MTESMETRVGKLEGQSHTPATCPVNQSNQRITWGLMGLVAALVGKESLVQLTSHTPNMDRFNFILTAYFYGGLTLFLFYRALRRRDSKRPLLAIAATLMALAGMVRLDIGFAQMTYRGSLFVYIPFLAASLLVLLERLLIWRRCL